MKNTWNLKTPNQDQQPVKQQAKKHSPFSIESIIGKSAQAKKPRMSFNETPDIKEDNLSHLSYYQKIFEEQIKYLDKSKN